MILISKTANWLLGAYGIAYSGSKTITFLESPTPICLFTMHFGGSTKKVIKVICENNARPCVKRPMSFCVCVKSRDLLKVP